MKNNTLRPLSSKYIWYAWKKPSLTTKKVQRCRRYHFTFSCSRGKIMARRPFFTSSLARDEKQQLGKKELAAAHFFFGFWCPTKCCSSLCSLLPPLSLVEAAAARTVPMAASLSFSHVVVLGRSKKAFFHLEEEGRLLDSPAESSGLESIRKHFLRNVTALTDTN